MADYTEQIAEIEAILDSGVTSTQEDGQVIYFDHESLRRRLAELKRRDKLQKKRPRWGSINLGDS